MLVVVLLALPTTKVVEVVVELLGKVVVVVPFTGRVVVVVWFIGIVVVVVWPVSFNKVVVVSSGIVVVVSFSGIVVVVSLTDSGFKSDIDILSVFETITVPLSITEVVTIYSPAGTRILNSSKLIVNSPISPALAISLISFS